MPTLHNAHLYSCLYARKMTSFAFLKLESSSIFYPIFNILFYLFSFQILSLVPALVNVFAQVAVSPDETSEVKSNIGRAFSHLISLYGHQMEPILSSLSPTHASALAGMAAIAPKN